MLGEGCSQDFQKAMDYYHRAARQGSKRAENDLGFCYLTGKGTKQDFQMAVKYLQKAEAQGHEIAKQTLSFYSKSPDDFPGIVANAIEFYHTDAERGDAQALRLLSYWKDLQHGFESG